MENRLQKILIFGNSSSGKSSLAKKFSADKKLAHLDLDTLAWLPELPPTRATLESSKNKILDFIDSNESWVIEGGYTDLIELLENDANEIIFMNLDAEQCIENAKARPWEPHKYSSKTAQDKNLDMLINWIKDYSNRDDVFSYKSHIKFYESFRGKKRMIEHNEK